MFYSLEFANSYSYKEKQDFNLVRPRREITKLAERWPDCGWNFEISPVAAVFGANAAGKSSLFRSLWSAIKNPTYGDAVDITPFKLNPQSESATIFFDLRFEAQDFTSHTSKCEYQYLFETSPSGTVLREELKFNPKRGGKFQRVFRRVLSQESVPDSDEMLLDYDYRWGESFKGEKTFVVRSTGADELFLGNTRALPNNPLSPVLGWMNDMVNFYFAAGYSAESVRIKKRLYEDPEYFARVIKYVQQADLGIVDLKVIARSEEDLAAMRRSLESQDFQREVIDKVIQDSELELTFTHSSNEGTFEFQEHHESDGTRAMLSFASIAIDALEKGSLLVIDEIDTSLHPLLVRELIRQFTSPESNPNQAQLVFSSHDLTLLQNPSWLDPLLERDQIWLVEKGENGSSSLYSIADFPTRNDENVYRKYLAGQYGSVPRPWFETLLDSEGK